VREVAYAVDPSIELRIELHSGTASSLSLNSLLKGSIKDKVAKISLSAIAFTSCVWLSNHALEFAYEQVLSAVLGQQETKDVSDAQIQSIVEKTISAYQKQVTEHGERFFRELETDAAISGVGASPNPGERPSSLVPREEFARRSHGLSGHTPVADERPTRRTRVNIETLTLISPVLLPGRRSWKFRGREGEFGICSTRCDHGLSV
jgi:hypothetical protein